VKVITEPKVTLVSFPSYRPHPVYELPAHDQPTENIIAMAGKVCYDSYGLDGNAVEKHIATLVNSGHHSVLEHVHVGLFIEGISRGCSHEIVRHRLFNYSQRSTRYTAEDDAAIVLDPYYATIEAGRGSHASDAEISLLDAFTESCECSVAEYSEQVKRLESLNPQQLKGRDLRKWCRGKARQLLPHALETRMVMTGNLRAWRHFLVMRSSRHAEAEIRRLASAVWFVLAPLAPAVFADLQEGDVDGYVELT
jgi:thymidylate synthase (FAD)